MPAEVKAEFDRALEDQNESSVIARLMQRGVSEHGRQLPHRERFNELSRVLRESATDEEIREARAAVRS